MIYRNASRIKVCLILGLIVIILTMFLIGCASEAEKKYQQLVALHNKAHGKRAALDVNEVHRIMGSSHSDEAIRRGDMISWDVGECYRISLDDKGFNLLKFDDCK